MENNLLTGKDMILQKAIGSKDFPSLGPREFCPSGSWLEKKQIQTSLRDTHSLLKSERIEKVINLATAEWLPTANKAKVVKKVGKHWEVFGHFKDNSDWLYPEEALFMLEINVLQLFYGNVPVSIEQGYLLLIGEDCTLEQYRVFSYLSKRGYKLLRHSKDLVETDAKSPNVKEISVNDAKATDLKEEEESRVNVSQNNDVLDQEKTLLSDSQTCLDTSSDDVYVVEDFVEIIEVDSDCSQKEDKMEVESKAQVKNESILIESEDSEDEVIYIQTSKKEDCRPWYPPSSKSLIPQNEEVQFERKFKDIDYFDVGLKTNSEILKNIAGNSKTDMLAAPDQRFIPKNIETKYPVYKINLNQPDEESEVVEVEKQENKKKHVRFCNDDYNPVQSVIPNQNYTNGDQNFTNRSSYNQRPNYYQNNFNYRGVDIYRGNNYQNNTYRANNFLPFQNRNENMVMETSQVQMICMNMMQTASRLLNALNVPANTFQSHIPFSQSPIYSFPSNYQLPRVNISNNPRPNYSNYSNPRSNFSNSRPFHMQNYQNRGWNPRYRHRGRNRGHKNLRPFNKRPLNSGTSEPILVDSDDDENYYKKHLKRISPTGFNQVKKDKETKEVKLSNKTKDFVDLTTCPSISGLKSETKVPIKTDSGEKPKETPDILYVCTKSSKTQDIVEIDSPQVDDMEIDVSKEIVPQDNSEKTAHQDVEIINPPEDEAHAEKTDDVQIIPPEDKDNANTEQEPTSWEQYKQFSLVNRKDADSASLVDLCSFNNREGAYESLQIFESIETTPDNIRQLKVSFDVHLPTDHFKKSLRTLPKFRVVVMSGQDTFPTKFELDLLKTTYQDNVQFLFASVLEESVAFYNYENVSITNHFNSTT